MLMSLTFWAHVRERAAVGENGRSVLRARAIFVHINAAFKCFAAEL